MKHRARIKSYSSARSVHLDLAEGYGNESFLATFRKFVTTEGFSGTSDGGTLLVAANKEVRLMVKEWDLSII